MSRPIRAGGRLAASEMSCISSGDPHTRHTLDTMGVCVWPGTCAVLAPWQLFIKHIAARLMQGQASRGGQRGQSANVVCSGSMADV